ncbi:MAG: AAA family ATPase, partial [Myxococcota bacterium]|nr:AAA family ATPase [Myxococcota bacterium]
MIAHLSIHGFGPHERTDLDFDPDGLTVLAGPSEAGKSTALDAACYALWGCGADGKPLPGELVRDGHKRAEVVLRLASGTTITRTRTRGGQQQRAIRKNGDERTYNREEEFRAALGPLGAQAEPARLVMVPFAWVELSRGPGGGRPLRDLLARILPEVDLAAIVARLMADAGQPTKPDDPLAEKRAFDLRAQRNAERERCAGQKAGLETLVARMEAEPVVPVSADAVSRALEMQEAARAWGVYDVAAERDVAAMAELARRNRLLEGWRARRAELGARPTGDDTALQTARERQRAADEAHETWRREGVRLAADLRAAELNRDAMAKRLADAEPEVMAAAAKIRAATGEVVIAQRKVDQLVAAGDRCPTCERPGWESAAAEVERARNVLAGKEAARGDAESANAHAVVTATARLEAEAGTAKETVARLLAEKAMAEAAEATARAEADAARAAVDAERQA